MIVIITRRTVETALLERYRGNNPATKLVIHISNFRPVKRVEMVVDIFHRIRERVPARLLLVGDGPDLPAACRRAREYGVANDVVPLW